MNRNNSYGHTPIDDLSGLKNEYVTTAQQLFDLEFINISKASRKYLLIGNKKVDLNLELIIKFHKDMFSDVWDWAGKQRTIELNVGVKPFMIMSDLKQCLDDLQFNETTDMSLNERVARFHHRLVKIHPFVNGNGRWARLLTNYYLRRSNSKLNWPELDLYNDKNIRKNYIECLKEADNGSYINLIDLISTWMSS